MCLAPDRLHRQQNKHEDTISTILLEHFWIIKMGIAWEKNSRFELALLSSAFRL